MMKKSKARLAFEMLEKEMALLVPEEATQYLGGTSSDGNTIWGIDSQGNFYYKHEGENTWTAFQPLNEVTVSSNGNGTLNNMYSDYLYWKNQTSSTGYNTGQYSSTGYNSNGYDSNGYNSNSYNSNGIFAGGGGGGGAIYSLGGQSSNETLPYSYKITATGPSQMSLLDVAGMMNTSLGTANSFAQASAIAAKLEVAAQFATAGKIFGYLDVASNVLEITDSKQSMLQHVEDGGQAVLGVALIFAGGPITIVAGGIVLAAWELWEYKRDN